MGSQRNASEYSVLFCPSFHIRYSLWFTWGLILTFLIWRGHKQVLTDLNTSPPDCTSLKFLELPLDWIRLLPSFLNSSVSGHASHLLALYPKVNCWKHPSPPHGRSSFNQPISVALFCWLSRKSPLLELVVCLWTVFLSCTIRILQWGIHLSEWKGNLRSQLGPIGNLQFFVQFSFSLLGMWKSSIFFLPAKWLSSSFWIFD